jgi:uncharacterized protein (TIGR00369 family)
MSDDIMLRVPFVSRTGARLLERQRGSARIALTVRPEHCDATGRLHGGVLTTLMDSTTAIALRELRGHGASLHASIEMNAGFLAVAVPGDEIVVSGRISRLGKAVAFGEAEVHRQRDGQLLATSRITFGIQGA